MQVLHILETDEYGNVITDQIAGQTKNRNRSNNLVAHLGQNKNEVGRETDETGQTRTYVDRETGETTYISSFEKGQIFGQ